MIVTPAKAGVSTLRFDYTGEIPIFAGVTCHVQVADSPRGATPAKGRA